MSLSTHDHLALYDVLHVLQEELPVNLIDVNHSPAHLLEFGIPLLVPFDSGLCEVSLAVILDSYLHLR